MKISMPDIFANSSTARDYTPAAGMVFVMRCVPDIFTGESLNIGVCAIDGATGKRAAKVVTEPGRLNCLYGEAASSVVTLAQVALEAALNGRAPPSPQITFDEPTAYYNAELQEIVDTTFADQVTVALPQRATASTNPLDDEQAMEAVANAIKTAKEFDMELLANTPQVIINTEKGPRTMRVPLQPRNGVGTVRSAYYSHVTLKNHLMDSVLDLECAARYRHKPHMGIFILRPAEVSREVAKQVDAVIDNISFRAPRNMMLEVAFDAPTLAQAIEHWAKKAG